MRPIADSCPCLVLLPVVLCAAEHVRHTATCRRMASFGVSSFIRQSQTKSSSCKSTWSPERQLPRKRWSAGAIPYWGCNRQGFSYRSCEEIVLMTAPHVVRLNDAIPSYRSSHPPVTKFSVFFRKALATTCSVLGAFAGCAVTSKSRQLSPYWRRVSRNVSKPISTSKFELPPSDAPQIKKAHAVKWTQFAGRPAVGLQRLAGRRRVVDSTTLNTFREAAAKCRQEALSWPIQNNGSAWQKCGNGWQM